MITAEVSLRIYLYSEKLIFLYGGSDETTVISRSVSHQYQLQNNEYPVYNATFSQEGNEVVVNVPIEAQRVGLQAYLFPEQQTVRV